MKKLAKILVFALGLGLLAAGLTMVTSSPAPAAPGPQPVNIAQVSVPSVPVSGTVAVNNFPTTQPVSGTVNIGNFPNPQNVTLAAGSSVNVSNPLDTSNNPTPLATLDASQPFEYTCTATSTSGTASALCNFGGTVGKRLVIQEVDVQVQLSPGFKPISVQVTPSTVNHFFTTTFMGSNGTTDAYATHQETRLYAGTNNNPSCFVVLSGNSAFVELQCQISGFLVDVP
jgi:hypothetical protein